MRKGLGQAVRHALEMAGLDELVAADRLVQLATAVHRGALANHFLEPGQVTLEDLDQLAWLALIDGTFEIEATSKSLGDLARAVLELH